MLRWFLTKASRCCCCPWFGFLVVQSNFFTIINKLSAGENLPEMLNVLAPNSKLLVAVLFDRYALVCVCVCVKRWSASAGPECVCVSLMMMEAGWSRSRNVGETSHSFLPQRSLQSQVSPWWPGCWGVMCFCCFYTSAAALPLQRSDFLPTCCAVFHFGDS